jgi:CRP-like cAMP-binding protein
MVRRNLVGLLRSLRGAHETKSSASGQTLAEPAAPAVSAVPRFGLEVKMRHLSAIDIFRDLEPEDLDWLAAHTTMITARRGQLLYMPGETSEVLFLLKSGRVRIYRLSVDGKKFVLSTLGPETFFGDMPLAGQQMYGTYAEAVEDSMLCVLGRPDLERLIETRPQVAIRLLEVVGRRLIEAETAIEDLAFRSVPARLAAALLRLTSEQDGRDLVGYTHQDLAEMVGTYRETATQALDDFKRRGLVKLGRKHIRIVDEAGLAAIAEG